MSVHQTRDHFLEKYGSIVDNPKVRTSTLTVKHQRLSASLLVDQAQDDSQAGGVGHALAGRHCHQTVGVFACCNVNLLHRMLTQPAT